MGFLGYLQKNQTEIRNWVDTLSKVAQVFAIVLAGIWTYKTFYESERPGLEPTLTTWATPRWAALPGESGICEGNLDVVVRNPGKRAVDVTGVRIRGWISDRVSMKSATPQLYTSGEVEKGLKFFDESVSSSVLIGHYPPGTEVTDTFVWFFRNEKNKVALWKVDLQTSKPIRLGTKNYSWAYVCQ